MIDSEEVPELNAQDRKILKKYLDRYPIELNTNATDIFLADMWDFVKSARVFRITLMGIVRGGKSTCGCSIAFIYKKMFNKALAMGLYDRIDVFEDGKVTKGEIDFNTDFVCRNQSEYLYKVKKLYTEGKLKFGQCFVIDENKEGIGGLGSYSESMELKNINNICAKYMISEIWITPVKFQNRNATYGLYMYKTEVDIPGVSGTNWALLFKIQLDINTPHYVFFGWLRMPMHPYKEFDKAYNHLKNSWIDKEMGSNGVDERTRERLNVAYTLAEDKEFCQFNSKNTGFTITKEQQRAMLDFMMMEGTITMALNETEKYSVIETARLIALQRKRYQVIEQQQKDLKEKSYEQAMKDYLDGKSDICPKKPSEDLFEEIKKDQSEPLDLSKSESTMDRMSSGHSKPSPDGIVGGKSGQVELVEPEELVKPVEPEKPIEDKLAELKKEKDLQDIFD